MVTSAQDWQERIASLAAVWSALAPSDEAQSSEAWPEQFDGVRAYLERTAALYPPRPGESQGPTSPPPPLRQLIGYTS